MLDAYFTLRMSKEQLSAIDQYRRRLPDIITRAEAIRSLVWLGILSSRTDKIREDKDD